MEYLNSGIEEVFERFKTETGKDLEKYRHHVYRVFHYCLLLDPDDRNKEKYALAAVFHDIGIWTDHTIDYLEPSIIRATDYLMETGQGSLKEEIKEMIYWHHKTGAVGKNVSPAAEVFRRADWVDVSLSIRKFGLRGSDIRKYRKLFPRRGFHFFLFKKILRQFLHHPLNPLPMFRNK